MKLVTVKRVVIIGAGVGGLAAAVRLAARGVRVLLLEKQDQVGGKLHRKRLSHPGRPNDRPFCFDTGPSLLTLPFVFQDHFAAGGADVRNVLSIRGLSPISRFIWQDGQSLELTSDLPRLLENVRRFAPGDESGLERFLDRGRHIWTLGGESFLNHAPEQIARLSRRSIVDGLRAATIPFRIGMFSKYGRLVDRLIRSQRLRDVLYQYATYAGASPDAAPATLAVIPHCELELGGWYIDGGMYKLAEALEALARKLGVDVRTSTAVTQIVTTGRAGRRVIDCVETSAGERFDCDAVLCNADVVWAYHHLIRTEDRPCFTDTKLARLDPGGSGMALLLGVDGTYPQLAHHTKFMPDDYRQDLRATFETRTLPADPCIYVCAPTRTDPSRAPDGCECLFVLCSAPPLDGTIDWSVEGPRYEARIIETLENRYGLTDLSRRIVVRKRVTPMDFAMNYNAHRGSFYGVGSNGIRSAFLRPPNRDRHIAGLFFAGGATHPGGGLPLVALSGKIASELICDHLDIRRPSIVEESDRFIATFNSQAHRDG